ncbi:MAG: PocR ligand-binding domain-containing protein [Oscillospiraceae bacterium]|nr:PocR ligand-binding domain-containing protein [Oscillospiraceae bacterium]
MLQINTANLYRVLKDFYILTKIRIGVFDNEFQELLSYPTEQQGFCGVLRMDAEEDAKCHASNRRGCVKCAKTQTLTFYRCHAGLTEAVVPISDRSGIIGYVMFGQILPQADLENARAVILEKYPQHSDIINAISAKSDEELNAAATVLQALTAYVMSNQWVTPGKSEFIRQLDAYIEQNLSRSITAEELCAQFHMGRTRLYDVSAEYLGCGLAEYIRSQRIAWAKRMLAETTLPVGQIADAVGFSDYNHFSRVFRQYAGISARTYRKNATGQ